MDPFEDLSTRPLPGIEVVPAGSAVTISEAQWSRGLPSLVFKVLYSGSQLGLHLRFEALDSSRKTMKEGDVFGTFNPGLLTVATITFSPDEASQIATLRLLVQS